jgi:hypothetical protein
VSSVVVGCVAERGGPVTLLRVGGDGVAAPWLQVPVRAVPAYQYASLAVCAGLVAALAVLARPMLAGWPWWLHAGLGVLVTLGVWLLVAVVADLVWARLVESLIVDTGRAVLAEAASGTPIEGRSST